MFKKMDEMEQKHSLKSIRIVYLYSVIFALACFIGEAIKTGSPSLTSNMFLLLISQNIVLFISRCYFKMKVDDPEGKKGIWLFIIVSISFFILGFVISFI